MSNLQSGEIVWIDLGATEGHEQAKIRPCVIVKAIPELKLHIIIPFSTKESSNPHFTTVRIPKENTPLSSDSIALCHQIRTVSEIRIQSKIGSLLQNDLDKIRFVMMDLLDSD